MPTPEKPTPATFVRADGSTSESYGDGAPFEAGHTRTLTHGTYSPRAIAERAVEVHAELLTHCPWLDEDRYLPSVQRYIEASAREALAHKAIMACTGTPSPRLLEAATSAARLAWRMGDELGLTPKGHLELRALLAGTTSAEASLADLAADGRRVMAARAQVVEATATDEVDLGHQGEEVGHDDDEVAS